MCVISEYLVVIVVIIINIDTTVISIKTRLFIWQFIGDIIQADIVIAVDNIAATIKEASLG